MVGVSAQEITQHVDSIARTTWLDNTLSVLESGFSIERSILRFHEDRCEHVVTEDLTPKVAVVLGIIASSKVTEAGSEIGSRSHRNSSVERSKLLEHFSGTHVFGLSVGDVMDGLV